jgi:hypothetical protein
VDLDQNPKTILADSPSPVLASLQRTEGRKWESVFKQCENATYTDHETDEGTIDEPATNQIMIHNIQDLEGLPTHSLPSEEVIHKEQCLSKI